MVTENLKKFDTPVFPFTAIVGQEEMKLALQLNVIDPKIGGVMIMGDRGTGKSTTIRAIADLLPEIEVVKDDPFNSHKSDLDLMGNEVKMAIQNGEELETEFIKIPMVDLPLGATEDRVCGTIDIEKALTEGVKAFEPGLLAKANRGILYVDEVNLLDDHLVDILLDSAASGWNTVEREGISIRHPARFVHRAEAPAGTGQHLRTGNRWWYHGGDVGTQLPGHLQQHAGRRQLCPVLQAAVPGNRFPGYPFLGGLCSQICPLSG